MFRSMFISCAISLLALTGCASIQKVSEEIGDAVTSKIDTTKAFGGLGDADTYAKCATADVVSTALFLSTTNMLEGNPLTKALYVKAFGHVLGTVIPVIGLSVAGYYILKWLDKPVVTATVAGLTCFAAARNLYLIIP